MGAFFAIPPLPLSPPTLTPEPRVRLKYTGTTFTLLASLLPLFLLLLLCPGPPSIRCTNFGEFYLSSGLRIVAEEGGHISPFENGSNGEISPSPPERGDDCNFETYCFEFNLLNLMNSNKCEFRTCKLCPPPSRHPPLTVARAVSGHRNNTRILLADLFPRARGLAERIGRLCSCVLECKLPRTKDVWVFGRLVLMFHFGTGEKKSALRRKRNPVS